MSATVKKPEQATDGTRWQRGWRTATAAGEFVPIPQVAQNRRSGLDLRQPRGVVDPPWRKKVLRYEADEGSLGWKPRPHADHAQGPRGEYNRFRGPPVNQELRSRVLRWVRVLAALGLIGGITLFYFRLVNVNSVTVALTFLLVVLGVATRWGLLEAVAASVAGMLCFNYFFLPPIATLTIADPQNWIALFAFVITAVM